MLLGIATSLEHKTPIEWAKKHKELGCHAVLFPVDCTASTETIEAYRAAAIQEDLTIAEVGIMPWLLIKRSLKQQSPIPLSS